MPEPTEITPTEIVSAEETQLAPTMPTGLTRAGKRVNRIETIRIKSHTGLAVDVPAESTGNRWRFRMAAHQGLELVEALERKFVAALDGSTKTFKDDGMKAEVLTISPSDLVDLAKAKEILWNISQEAYEGKAMPSPPTGPVPHIGMNGMARLIQRKLTTSKLGEVVTQTEETMAQYATDQILGRAAQSTGRT